jgi:hypothetical protein
MLFAVDEYSHWKHLYAKREGIDQDNVRPTILLVVAAYVAAIAVGLALPSVAVGLYCLLALCLVIPYRELARIFVDQS